MSKNATTVSKLEDKVCRVVIQQCIKAELEFDTSDPPVSISSGMVLFVCFLQGATLNHLENIVKGVLNAKLCEEEGSPARDSVLKYGKDVLIIPQATLGGKMKGKSVQYHELIEKSLGEEMFSKFVEKVKESVGGDGKRVQSGVYGARQILNMKTNGPFTHVFDF